MRALILRHLLIGFIAWVMADSVEILHIVVRLTDEAAAAEPDGYCPISVRYRHQIQKQIQTSFANPCPCGAPCPRLVDALACYGLEGAEHFSLPGSLSRYELKSMQV
jgi:hypothetical protein